MIILTIEDLEGQGVTYRTTSQFVFQQRTYTKGQSFSQRARQAAIALCESYLAAGKFCLLVEAQDHITVCPARLEPSPPLAPPTATGNSGQPAAQSVAQLTAQTPIAPSSTTQAESEKATPPKPERQYRGAVIPSTHPTQPTTPAVTHSHLKLTYRGAKVDTTALNPSPSPQAATPQELTELTPPPAIPQESIPPASTTPAPIAPKSHLTRTYRGKKY